MENQPEAPAAAPAAESVATPTNSNPAPAPEMPDMHGFTSEQLADMRKFYDNNGGWEKVKARISNPEPAQKPAADLNAAPVLNQQQNAMQAQPAQSEQPAYKAPEGSITRDEFEALRYAEYLSKDPKYAAISKEIESGEFLKEMTALGIKLVNQDKSFNDGMVRKFLDLKAQTVVAKQTSASPEAGAAPTVDYAPYDENNMNMVQAMAILQQDSALRTRGMAGHPNAAQAEEFMKKSLNPQK